MRLLEVLLPLQQRVSLQACPVPFRTQIPLYTTAPNTPPHSINFMPWEDISNKESDTIMDMQDMHNNLEVPSRVDSDTHKLWDRIKATVPLTMMIKVIRVTHTIPDQVDTRTRAAAAVADIVDVMHITTTNTKINTILNSTVDTLDNPTVWGITDTLLEE